MVDDAFPEPSLSERLGHFVSTTQFEAIPADVIERAKVSLVHNLAVAVAGRPRERVAHAMAKALWPSPAQATLLHDGSRTSLEAAAFANAALIHARSQDDTHAGSTSHPGGPVMPAALSVGEFVGASGAEFLAAVVLGYEVLCRVGRDFDDRITARGFRAAPVVGGFGAAAAAARLLRLPAHEVPHALGLAAHLAGGLAQVWAEGSAEGPLQLGFAARNGVLAARSAQHGATAARRALDGERGFHRAYAGAEVPAVEAVAGLGMTWQFREVTVKAHPACAILQGPLDSLRRLMRHPKASAPAVAAIELHLNPFEAAYPGVDNPGPIASATAAKMSAQFCLALAATDGRVTMDGLDRLADGAVRSLSARVRVIADSEVALRSSMLLLRLSDGTELRDDIRAPVGQPSLAEAVEFAHALTAEMGVKADAFEAMVEAVDALERAPDLVRLIAGVTSAVRAVAGRPA